MASRVVAVFLGRKGGIIKRGWHEESLKPAGSQNNQWDRGIGIRCYRQRDNVGFFSGGGVGIGRGLIVSLMCVQQAAIVSCGGRV